jgi:hypothetical protein
MLCKQREPILVIKSKHIPFHDRSDIDATIAALVRLANNTYTEKVDCIWNGTATIILILKAHYDLPSLMTNVSYIPKFKQTVTIFKEIVEPV